MTRILQIFLKFSQVFILKSNCFKCFIFLSSWFRKVNKAWKAKSRWSKKKWNQSLSSLFLLTLFSRLKKNGDAFSSAFSLLLLRFLNHFAFAFEFAVWRLLFSCICWLFGLPFGQACIIACHPITLRRRIRCLLHIVFPLPLPLPLGEKTETDRKRRRGRERLEAERGSNSCFLLRAPLLMTRKWIKALSTGCPSSSSSAPHSAHFP